MIVVIPSGPESLVFDAELGRFVLFEKIESDTARDSEVMRAMAFAQAGLTLSESEFNHPVTAIIDLPMRANGTE